MQLTLAEVRRRMLLKIKDSCLVAADAKRLGLVPALTAPPAITASAPGFVIPYWGLGGKPLDFYRYRYLEQPPRNGFAALTATKPLRYTQPAGLKPRAYFSPLYPWQELAARKPEERRYVITEGELKANCACKLGLPCIGLGGVWNFKRKESLGLIDDLEQIEWAGVSVYITYDSDAASNYQIIQAENAFAKQLLDRGALVHILRLPAVLKPPLKTGLDDYLRVKGVEAWIKLALKTEVWAAARVLHELNEELVYIHDPGLVMSIASGQRMRAEVFANSIYANRYWESKTVTPKGEEKVVLKKAAKEWIGWPARAEVVRTTYAPGGVVPITAEREFNTWPGWGIKAEHVKPGPVKLWKDLLDHIFTGALPEERRWFEQWLAYPLQHPGTKLYSAPVVWGLRQGTGKTLIGHTMARIYGRNFAEIEKQNLLNPFNEWAVDKQFVMGDEITSDDKRDSADRMKSVITRNQIRINAKYLASYVVPDCINYYFTSNHPDSFFLDDNDRRYFVHKVTGGPLSGDFYAAYDKWYRTDAGAGALFYYLLHLDLVGFSPTGHAPGTSSKKLMVESGRSEAAEWVTALRDAPEALLPVGLKTRTLWTTTELFSVWDPLRTKKLSPPGLGRELQRGGLNRVHRGEPVRVGTDALVKLWALGPDREKLETLPPERLRKLYLVERSAEHTAERMMLQNQERKLGGGE